jgi:hypothetical protein
MCNVNTTHRNVHMQCVHENHVHIHNTQSNTHAMHMCTQHVQNTFALMQHNICMHIKCMYVRNRYNTSNMHMYNR